MLPTLFHHILSIALLSILLPLSSASPIPSPNNSSKFHFFHLPTPSSGPCDLTQGPDNALWVQDILVPKIARIDPVTGTVDEYTIPYTQDPLPAPSVPSVDGVTPLACAIRPGADGMIYASAGTRNELVRIDPVTREIKVLRPPAYNPLGDLQPFNDMWTGPHGMYFTQTTGNVITYYSYASGNFTNFAIPTPLSGPLGLKVSDATGDVWFCEFLASKMAKLDPVSGKVTEYPLGLELEGPAVVRAETEGRFLWFTALLGNSIGRIDMFTGETKAYSNDIAPLSLPSEDTLDGDGNVWFSTWTENTLNKLDTSTGIISTIVQPDAGVGARIPPYVDVPVNYGPGNNIWFADTITNRIGYYSLD